MVEPRRRYSLAQINEMALLPYARTMAVIFANASWVPVLAFPHRPFRDLTHLHQSMYGVLAGSDVNSKLQVIDQQPDLVNPPPPEDEVSEFQLFECDLEFHRSLTAEHRTKLASLQAQYMEVFGFNLVFSPAGSSVDDLLGEIGHRLARTQAEELQRAVEEAGKLARSRLDELILPE